METEPDTTNVVYIDEYPHLLERRRLRQALAALTLQVNTPNQIIVFPEQPGPNGGPDGAA